MHLMTVYSRSAFRSVTAVLLVLALAACGASGPSGGGDRGGNGSPSTDFRWMVVVPTTFEEVKGTTATVSDDAITGTNSTPANWSIVMSRPGGFVELGTYASYDDPDTGVSADLTVSITAPNGLSCTVGPGNTSISEDGPEPGDTLAQATYFGTDEDDGRPLVSFASMWAACDELPGASGSGEVDVWLFGFGSP